MIAIKKNRKENGIREELIGSNPHSNGDLFSRSIIVFLDKVEASNMIMLVIIKIIVLIIKVEKIIYTKYYLVLMIGSHIYCYTI